MNRGHGCGPETFLASALRERATPPLSRDTVAYGKPIADGDQTLRLDPLPGGKRRYELGVGALHPNPERDGAALQRDAAGNGYGQHLPTERTGDCRRYQRIWLYQLRRNSQVIGDGEARYAHHHQSAPPLCPLSIIIPTLNEARNLPSLLRALAPARDRGAEVLVVDGGSEDETVALAEGHGVTVLRAERGRGPQAGPGC